MEIEFKPKRMGRDTWVLRDQFDKSPPGAPTFKTQGKAKAYARKLAKSDGY